MTWEFGAVRFVVAALLMAAFAGRAGAGPLDVPLRLEEPIGVARRGEPIRCGVPLPNGVSEDPRALRLFDEEGEQVAAAFTPATRWWRDGSLKWVHVDLQRSLPAGASQTLYLRMGDRSAPPDPHELLVEESEAAVTVTTGPLRFRVSKRAFNLFDQVWLDDTCAARFDDEHALLADRPRGFRVSDGRRTGWAAADPDCRVTVEEQNPFRVVIRAEGRHLAADGSAVTDFITRISAYSGKPYVTVSHAFLVRQGAEMDEYMSVHDVGLELPLNLAPGVGGLDWRMGGSAGIHAGKLARNQTVHLHQYSADRYAIYRAPNENWWDSWRLGAETEGTGHSVRTGWIDLSDGSRGVAVGVRDFWQLCPKALEAGADSRMFVALYPDQTFNDPLLLYPGMARTHEMTIYFHGVVGEETISDLMAASQAPLMLIAPPKWYCRGTLAFGYLPEADPAIYDPAYGEVVEAFEQRFRRNFEHILRRRDTREGLPPGVDEYGIIGFGDGFQHHSKGVTYWSDNYYDFPHALILQFARTGRRAYLDAARRYARHLGDIDISCYETHPNLLGGPRVCPAIDHVRAYYDGSIGTSLSFNFYKNQSLFEMWFLTGDRRFLETALLSASFVLTQEGIGLSEPRSIGHAYIALRAAWEATGDEKYLERGRHFWERVAAYQDEQRGGFPHSWSFQVGLVMEGLRDWHHLTDDPTILERIRRAADWMIETYGEPDKGFRDPTAYTGFVGCGVAWELTGDRRYLDAPLRHARETLPTSYGTRVKDYGMAFRSSPYFLWWLQRDPAPTVRSLPP